jgi:hypothetical protein
MSEIEKCIQINDINPSIEGKILEELLSEESGEDERFPEAVDLAEKLYVAQQEVTKKHAMRNKRLRKFSNRSRRMKKAVDFLDNDKRRELANEIKKKAREYKIVNYFLLIIT